MVVSKQKIKSKYVNVVIKWEVLLIVDSLPVQTKKQTS